MPSDGILSTSGERTLYLRAIWHMGDRKALPSLPAHRILISSCGSVILQEAGNDYKRHREILKAKIFVSTFR